jgi:hypothetical protein
MSEPPAAGTLRACSLLAGFCVYVLLWIAAHADAVTETAAQAADDAACAPAPQASLPVLLSVYFT